MRSGGVQKAAEKGRMNEKNLETIKDVWKPCNPLKSHKTAKDFFGKAWSKTRDFWRSLEKGFEGAFIPPPLAPSTNGLRSSGIVTARSEAAKQLGGSVSRGPWVAFAALCHTEKRKACFIQGDRLEDGAELAMTARPYLENFLYFSRCGTTLSIPSRRFLSSS